ncbi:MAG: ribosome rescue protein RqcH [Candidatus Thermoplasmatota archaeon]|jgi:predicted ribosome quality control (RQC) complex YloA/Tae2 family protein
MKQGMTNVDVAALAAELAPLLVGGRLDKAYQPAKDQILLRLRRKGAGKQDLLIQIGRFITLTRRPAQNPDKPSMVAQILRTTFENSRLIGFRQLGFDRLLRLDFERGDGKHSLVVELFGDGNLLILDADDKIVLPMRGEDHGARRLRKGERYLPPPGSASPFGMDIAALRTAASTSGGKDLVRFLAIGLGFGPLWAEELCLRSGIDKKSPLADLGESAWMAVHAAIASLGQDIGRNDLAPAIVYEDGKPVDAVPFVMARYPAPRFTHEESPTFREALDILFVGAGGDDEEEPDDPRRPKYEEAIGKVDQQLRQMDEAIGGFVAKEREDQLDGDALYASFGDVQTALDALNKARLERSWAAVEATLAKGRAEGNPFALRVPEVRPHSGEAVLLVELPDGTKRKVTVDLRLTVQENAEACYAAAKKSRSRREGAETARKDAEGRRRAVEKAGLDAFGAAPVRAERQSRHFWFEGYRWALLPSGLLAVGGRNAAQNDQVVKKYLRDGDRYVHADVHGAPSVVVRPSDGVAAETPPTDLRVACQFAVCASRAWRQGGSASAYWVTPAQVSKTPRSGEFVPRGAWIIHGKRNAEDHLSLEWAVGPVDFESDGTPVPAGSQAKGRAFRKLAGGPPAGLRPFTSQLVLVKPGTMDPNDAAAALAERFDVPIEDAQAAMPAGSVQLEG